MLTTASDARETLAVDLLGRELGWRFEATHDEIVRCSAAVVNDEPVALVQEAGAADWWPNHANGRKGPLPANLSRFDRLEDVPLTQFAAVLWVAERDMPAHLVAALAGRCGVSAMKLALGLGCDRGTPAATIVQAITEALAQAGATLADIHAVASIDLKADEIGLATVAAAHGWTICFYPASVLAEVEVPNPSATVRKYAPARPRSRRRRPSSPHKLTRAI